MATTTRWKEMSGDTQAFNRSGRIPLLATTLPFSAPAGLLSFHPLHHTPPHPINFTRPLTAAWAAPLIARDVRAPTQPRLLTCLPSLRRDPPHYNNDDVEGVQKKMAFQSLRRDTPHGNGGYLSGH